MLWFPRLSALLRCLQLNWIIEEATVVLGLVTARLVNATHQEARFMLSDTQAATLTLWVFVVIKHLWAYWDDTSQSYLNLWPLICSANHNGQAQQLGIINRVSSDSQNMLQYHPLLDLEHLKEQFAPKSENFFFFPIIYSAPYPSILFWWEWYRL